MTKGIMAREKIPIPTIYTEKSAIITSSGYTLRSADSSEPGYELRANLSGYATNPTRQASEPVVKIASIRILKDSRYRCHMECSVTHTDTEVLLSATVLVGVGVRVLDLEATGEGEGEEEEE